MLKVLILFSFMISSSAWSQFLAPSEDPTGLFSGRVARKNNEAGLIRFKVDFNNQKYLNKNDQVEFWDMRNPSLRCRAIIMGKSNDYVLVKVPDFNFCDKYVSLALGNYIQFYSQDLVNNLKMGREVFGVMTKKRLALTGQAKRGEQDLHAHVEKVNATNERYRLLREKLEAEWRDELSKLEEDKLRIVQRLKSTESRLDELDFKMEQYKITDENLTLDRWSLDPKLYYRK
jgi:hypothetical protein